jgi:hypothetical protein
MKLVGMTEALRRYEAWQSAVALVPQMNLPRCLTLSAAGNQLFRGAWRPILLPAISLPAVA